MISTRHAGFALRVMTNDPVFPKFVDSSRLNEDWAMRVHSQTLEHLNSRGGLSPDEIYHNVNRLDRKNARFIKENPTTPEDLQYKDDVIRLLQSIAVKP